MLWCTQYSRGEIEAGSLAYLVRFIPMRDSVPEKEGEWCLNNDIRLSLGLGRWQIWMFQHHWLGGNCVNGWSVDVATSWCPEAVRGAMWWKMAAPECFLTDCGSNAGRRLSEGQGTLPSPFLASFLLSQFPQSVSVGPLGTEVSQHLRGGAACSSNCKGLCPCLWPLADSTPRKERQMEET